MALGAFGVRGMLAQTPQPVPPLPQPVNASTDPLLKAFVWREIGPANMGGRIDDIAVVESNPSIIYVGFATGGIWKSVNNGTTWTPIFDEYPVSSIGDIAIAPSNPNIIYVGTGEANNRQSSSFGGGVYKSTDGGKTFEYVGLEGDAEHRADRRPPEESQHRLRRGDRATSSDPTPSAASTRRRTAARRGRTRNSSTTTPASPTSSCDPTNPEHAVRRVVPAPPHAVGLQRRRHRAAESGRPPTAARPGRKLTGQRPARQPVIGRIGLDFARSKPQTIYAQIEVGPSGGTGAGVNEDGTLRRPAAGAAAVRAVAVAARGIGRRPIRPKPASGARTTAASRGVLSNTTIARCTTARSASIPTNPEIVYQGGAPFFKSIDGGKTLATSRRGSRTATTTRSGSIRTNSNHLIIGNDGGLDVTYDQAETGNSSTPWPVGQFYEVSVDMRRPYYVCGGLQDNGSWCGPSAARAANGILNSDWYRVGGGDGFYTANDPTRLDDHLLRVAGRRDATVSICAPAGRSASGRAASGPRRSARRAAPRKRRSGRRRRSSRSAPARPAHGNIVPRAAPGHDLPLLLEHAVHAVPAQPVDGVSRRRSALPIDQPRRHVGGVARPHQNIGRNDRPIMGVDGKAPMASKHDGAASFSNIVTIGESPVVPGMLWVGTNDGNVQVSRDGGDTWTNVIDKIPGVPKETHVSRVEPSHFDAGTCYVTFDGHRTDDMKPYVFVTRTSARRGRRSPPTCPRPTST